MTKYLKFDLLCVKCGKEFTWEIEKKKFREKDIKKCCSRKCSNSRIQTTEMNVARRNKLLGVKCKPSPNKGKQIKERIIKKCENIECSNTFKKLPSYPRKYCNTCSKKFVGGYREGSGRSKHGYYKGIYCGSTYELVWVIYNIDNNIEFKRFENTLEFEGIKYIPDFIIGNTIHEIKGFGDKDRIAKKCEVAKKNGYDIVVLYKKDIQYMFDYVSSKYKTKKYFELYDEYAPKYNYICGTCGKEFGRDKKSKLLINFCSRFCSSKYSPNAIDRDEIIRLHSEGKSNKEISQTINCDISHLRIIKKRLKLV